MKQYLLLTASSLFLFLAGCGSADEKATPKSENDIDAARNFIQSALDGKFAEAKTFLFKDSSNNQYFDLYQQSYQKADPETTRNYREATIQIHEVQHVNDSVTIIVYSNSYKKDKNNLRLLLKDSQWLVDLKYLFLQGKDTIQMINLSQKDSLK